MLLASQEGTKMISKYFEISKLNMNIRCKVYFEKGNTVRYAVIFGHGFGGHKDNKAAERYAEHTLKKHSDAAVITFNWPCHGDDVRKKLTLDDCLLYLQLTIEDAKERFPQASLFGYATSFGGYLFLKYIQENGQVFQKAAFRCPAVNMYQVLTEAIMKNDELELIRKGKSVQVGFDRKIAVSPAFLEELHNADIRSADFLEYYETLLILHGTRDEVVPFDDSREFAENNLIEFIPVEGADHRFQDPKKMDLAIREIQNFFAWQ